MGNETNDVLDDDAVTMAGGTVSYPDYNPTLDYNYHTHCHEANT